MATYNGDSYVDFKNINLRGGMTGPGLIRWDPASLYGSNGALWGSNPFGTADYGLYINSSGKLVYSAAGSTTILGAAGGIGTIPTWNQVWGAAQSLQLAGVSTFTIDNNTGNNNVLTLTNTGTGSGVLLQITNAGAGSDIAGTSATWTISKAGVVTAKSVTFAGTAGTTSLEMTLGDIVTDDGGLALTKAANNATLTVTNNSSTSASAIVFVGNGTYTGNTTSSWFTLTPSGLTTGTAVYLATVALVSGKALQLNYAGTTSQTTGIQMQILNSSTAMQASARIFSVSHTGVSSSAGAGILSEFTSAAADATDILKITATSTLTGSALWISAGSMATGIGLAMTLTGLTTGTGIQMTGMAALTTGVGISMAHTTSVITDTGSMVRLSSTGINTGGATNGTMLDIQTTLQVAGTQVLIKGAAVTTGVLLSLATTTGMTSGSVLRATTSTAGAIATNGAFSFTGTGIFTSGAIGVGLFHIGATATTAGTIFSIKGDGLITGVAAYISDTAGTGITSGSLLRVASATTGAVATNGVVSFQMTGAYTVGAATVGAVHIVAASTVAGTIFSILGGAQTTGVAAYISDPSTGMTSGSLLRVVTATTGAVATNGIVSIQASGVYTSTAATLGMFHVSAVATVAGTIMSILGGAQTTGVGLYVSDGAATGLTSGSLIRVATATTGAVATNGVVSIQASANYSSTANVGLLSVIANSTTAGTVAYISGTGLTTGVALYVNATGTYTGTGIVTVTATGMTGGAAVLLTGGGVNLLTAGIVLSVAMGAATVGSGIKVLTSGAYTDTSAAVLNIVASTAGTTGNILAVTSISSKAIIVGATALTNPVFQVDCSTATAATGILIKGAAATNGVAISVQSSNGADFLTIDAKGLGRIVIGGTSTGQVSIGRGSLSTIIESSTTTAIGTTQNSTPTAAQLLGGVVTQTSATGAGTITLPTGTQISTAIPGVATGDLFTCVFANLGGGFTLTVTVNTNITVVGTATVASATDISLTFVCTGANTWICYTNK